mmetsp:Transcript_40828/g.108205  ORF Transcript_40828/g.108205 Transcript_40828/m.108205 type:complete len:232 (+) Transcript_40828:332-1027(+)
MGSRRPLWEIHRSDPHTHTTKRLGNVTSKQVLQTYSERLLHSPDTLHCDKLCGVLRCKVEDGAYFVRVQIVRGYHNFSWVFHLGFLCTAETLVSQVLKLSVSRQLLQPRLPLLFDQPFCWIRGRWRYECNRVLWNIRHLQGRWHRECPRCLAAPTTAPAQSAPGSWIREQVFRDAVESLPQPSGFFFLAPVLPQVQTTDTRSTTPVPRQHHDTCHTAGADLPTLSHKRTTS